MLVVAEVKYKKQEGALVLTPSRVGWSPEGESQLVVDVLYGKIKGLPTCIHISYTWNAFRESTAANLVQHCKSLIVQKLKVNGNAVMGDNTG